MFFGFRQVNHTLVTAGFKKLKRIPQKSLSLHKQDFAKHWVILFILLYAVCDAVNKLIFHGGNIRIAPVVF